MTAQPFLFGDDWIEVRDGNDTARALFDRHYSRHIYADGRRPRIFMGPGEKMVLLSPRADAVFGWRKFISRDHQDGVNCAIFRNEGPELAHFVRGLKGMVVLSGYPAALYDDALPDWMRVEREALADGARPRLEVLWINPACAARLTAAANGPLFEGAAA